MQRQDQGETGDVVQTMNPEAVVREFWRLMASNDFESVRQVLAADFVMEWPQSKERICGGRNFARMNTEYPSQGLWQFRINRLVAGEDTVVTQVSITDGAQRAEPVSFFTVVNGQITRLVEYWPEPYPAPASRAHLVEPMA
jgi:ketosteroid isomerase-like protein